MVITIATPTRLSANTIFSTPLSLAIGPTMTFYMIKKITTAIMISAKIRTEIWSVNTIVTTFKIVAR